MAKLSSLATLEEGLSASEGFFCFGEFAMVLQILVNLIFAAGFVVVWIRLNKPAKDDPRLSRGLQLLQSKIAILEDLSDQVERQVQQVAQLMEIKAKDLQSQVSNAEDQMRQIEIATAKSLEVAKIFQDRIPHEEIADRKATLKYIKAARLANQGVSVEEIVEQVDLPRGEIEFVAKVNREQLQFSDADLPDWAKSDSDHSTTEPDDLDLTPDTLVEAQPLMRFTDHANTLGGTGHAPVEAQPPGDAAPSRSGSPAASSLQALGSRFRQAIEPTSAIPNFQSSPHLEFLPNTPGGTGHAQSTDSKSQVKKVIFPRIDKPLF